MRWNHLSPVIESVHLVRQLANWTVHLVRQLANWTDLVPPACLGLAKPSSLPNEMIRLICTCHKMEPGCLCMSGCPRHSALLGGKVFKWLSMFEGLLVLSSYNPSYEIRYLNLHQWFSALDDGLKEGSMQTNCFGASPHSCTFYVVCPLSAMYLHFFANPMFLSSINCYH
jgi:hypothetical protein